MDLVWCFGSWACRRPGIASKALWGVPNVSENFALGLGCMRLSQPHVCLRLRSGICGRAWLVWDRPGSVVRQSDP